MNPSNMSLTLTSNQSIFSGDYLSGDYLSGDYLSLYRKRVAYGEDPDTIILYLTNLINNRKTSKEVRPTSNQKLVRLAPEKMEAMMEELHTSNESPFVDKESTKPKSTKKEPTIEYIEVEEFADGNNQFLYGLPDAESYINHMKIKDVKKIIKIGVAYSDKSMRNDNFKQLLTESRQDEKWIIKKTSRNQAKKTEEEIKEERIDFENNCQSCIYNGSLRNMRPCKRTKTVMRGTHRICNAHNKTADEHLKKYMNWTVDMGTHYGWYGEEKTYHQDYKTTKNPNYKPPVRKKVKHTEEEIKKQEEGIDFNINCQSCIYNGKKGSMRPCKKVGTLTRGTYRICVNHNKQADKHLLRWEGWTVEMGTHLGWYGEEETYHLDIGRKIKVDYVKKSIK